MAHNDHPSKQRRFDEDDLQERNQLAELKELRDRFHQRFPLPSTNPNILWYLPVEPFAKTTSTLRKVFKPGLEFSYHQMAYSLRRNWHDGPACFLPEEFQPTTAWSFALYSRLHLLASQSKDEYQWARLLLSTVREARLRKLGLESRGSVQLLEHRTSPAIRDAGGERLILQNVFGLTISDLEHAIKWNHRMTGMGGMGSKKKDLMQERRELALRGPNLQQIMPLAWERALDEGRRALDRASDHARGKQPDEALLTKRAQMRPEILSRKRKLKGKHRRHGRGASGSIETLLHRMDVRESIEEAEPTAEGSQRRPDRLHRTTPSMLLPSEKFDFNETPSLRNEDASENIAKWLQGVD